MNLIDQIIKYKEDKNKTRLTVILESHQKKVTKSNIAAIELLIADDDIPTLEAFLGIIKEKTAATKIGDDWGNIPHNQDDFIYQIIQNYGDPKDPASLGNKILTGKVYKWYISSFIPPDEMLKKFAYLAGKDPVAMNYYGSDYTTQGVPGWNCGLDGVFHVPRHSRHDPA